MPLTPEQRRIRASIAAHTSWANTDDRTARTAPGRQAVIERFEREADPTNQLGPAERRRRALHLQAAHMGRISLISSKRRAARAAGNTDGEVADLTDR